MMADKYKNFAELEQNEREDEDYTIFCREADSDIVIMAPHGGGIEPGTADIADALAGYDYAFYAFKGLKHSGNRLLHITSNAFDEPRGLEASQKASITAAIHGSGDTAKTIQIGGKNQALMQQFLQALRSAGFDAEITEQPGLMGLSPENICNRCKSKEGVQLEVSRGLREILFDNLDDRSLRRKTIRFYQFVNALQRALAK